MAKAYVMINTDAPNRDDVLEKLQKESNVSEVKAVFGAYDLVVTTKDIDNDTILRDFITYNIRKTEHVRSTITLMVIEKFEE